ncbi:tyrosine-type recombinase/integrase [Pseudomonas sp. stari2]|uniref:tyrosine-type recombinase/integrase n=1 Tax=Pseudomonas sp. Stari2 TaxID=2954814 RepID=UPI00345D2350
MLTDKQLRAMKAGPSDYTISDSKGSRGDGALYVKVKTTGVKEFYHVRFVNQKKRRKKLGNWPALSLADARQLCNAASEQDLSGASLSVLLDSYVAKLKEEGAASHDDVKWSFKKYVTEPHPEVAKLPASLVEPGHIRDILSKMIQAGVTTFTNRVRARLHAAFQHGLNQENNPREYLKDAVQFGLKHNPVTGVPVQKDWERSGERALSVKELGVLWNLLPEELSLVTSELIKFLIATGGQRPTQLLSSDRSMYHKDHVLIRDAKGKVGERTVHTVPLNALALGCLERLSMITAENKYPFSGKDLTESIHTNSLSRAVSKLYSRHKSDFAGPFTLRDIRRTCKTLMGVAGISKEIRDRIQGHAFSDVSSKHYDRYDYFKEKQAALNAWAAWLVGEAKVIS